MFESHPLSRTLNEPERRGLRSDRILYLRR